MIRPATKVLRDHAAKTSVAVGFFAVAMVLPGIGFLSATTADRLLRRWLADYRPVVYLAPEARGERAGELAGEIRKWDGVSECAVRAPGEAYEETASRLGEERLSKVGARPEMFPYSLVVEPAGGVAGVGVLSRLEALPTEAGVDSVDVPSARVTSWLSAVDTVRWTALGASVVLFGLALVAVADTLREFRHRERAKLRLFEKMGASAGQLRRATLIRGAVIGLWAGLAAACILLAIALYWRTIEEGLLGGFSAAAPRNWLVVAGPLVVGPVGGVLAGVFVARRSPGGPPRRIPGLEPLLDHG